MQHPMIVSFRERSREPIVYTQDAKDASGITEPLQSPSPSDGEILMGESLMVNMRISNLANVALDTIQMKVELQTELQTLQLSEGSNTIHQIPPGGSHDLTLAIDVKDVKNSLVCGVTYMDPDGIPHSQQSAIKFTSCNPLSVHTKTKSVAGITFLEVSLGNVTKESELILDPLQLDTPQGITAHLLTLPSSSSQPPVHHTSHDASFLPSRLDCLHHLRPGSVQNCLFEVKGQLVGEGVKRSDLGKLQIRWRRHLGQKGRLTTQHITAAGLGGPTVVVHMRGVPPHGAALECPMAVSLSISNTTRRPLGSLHLVLQPAAGSITAEPFLMIGQQSERMESVPPRSTVSLHLMLLPVVTGMQTLSGACVTDDAARLVATLPDTTIIVRN